MYCPGYYFFSFNFETHTHTLVWYMFGNKKSKKLFFKTHVFILLLVSYSFGDEGQGCLSFKNPCVFFSKKCM